MTVEEMRSKRIRLVGEADEILQRARTENRDLSADENAQFDRIHGEVDSLGARIKREERSASMLAEMGEGTGRRTDPVNEQRSNGNGGGLIYPVSGRLTNEQRAAGLQSWFLAGSDADRTPAMIEAARRCGVNLDSRRMRIALPSTSLRSMGAAEVREWESRALQVGTESPDAGGSNTVPNELMRSLEVALLRFGGMRRVATVNRTNSGADLPIPTLNDTNNEGAILAESGEVTELDPSFSSLQLEAYKYTSRMILVSVEFLQDSSIAVADRIGTMLGERIGRISNRHFTTGTGSGQPKGITVAATSSSITTAAATTVTYDNLVDLEHSVDPDYRGPGAGFMFADAILKILKKIKVPQFSGDTAGTPLWKAGMSSGDPDTINGYPYVINQAMPTTAGGKAITFGDHSKYQIRDVKDVTLLRLDERYAEFHQVAFLAFSRHDGDLLDAGTHPVKYLTLGA